MTVPTILVAPGPYKECLDAKQVTDAMVQGVRDILPDAEVLTRPLSDGGSGIATLLVEETGGRLIPVTIKDPIGRDITSTYGLLGDRRTAVIESAAACGLALVPKEWRNPLSTSTFGVGQLIRHAIEVNNAGRVIVGCGDSSTNDCGIGMASALGVRFIGVDDGELLSGKHLKDIRGMDASCLSGQFRDVEFLVACNLTSILCGPEGTSRIYGPQKGATTEEQVRELELGVENFAAVVYRDLGFDVSFFPGAGGSGGLAASLYSFLNARLLYSIDVVDSFFGLDNYLSRSSLVITGEGRIDDRTATGKVACGLALKAKRYGLPVIAVVGSISDDCEDIYYNGIDVVTAIQEGPINLEESMRDASGLVARATARILRSVFRLRGRGLVE